MAIAELWVEKYRPDTKDGYVFRDEAQQKVIESWIEKKEIPHLLLSGAAGTGKTTLGKMLVNELDIDDRDYMEINASRDNSVDYIRNTITGFVQTMPFGEFKVVLLDEADYLSLNAQAVLRNLMESNAGTARFILTCNFPNKIMNAISSRSQGFHLSTIDKTEFTARIATILIEESIDFDLATLDNHVQHSYPDLRKCINNCQMCSSGGKLLPMSNEDEADRDYIIDVINLFKQKKFTAGRKKLNENVSAMEMDLIFRWAYDNLEMFGDDEQQDQCIIIIRNGIVNHAIAADPEINLVATLIEISQV